MAVDREKVERLCAQTGVSEAAARAALEQTGGDLLEAALLLERAGQIPTVEGGTYSTASGPAGSAGTAPGGTNGSRSGRKAKRPAGGEGKKAAAKAASPKEWETFFRAVWDVFVHGRWEVWRKGKRTVAIPLWVMVILLCVRFPLVLIVLAVCLLADCRYRLTGPDFNGRKEINGFLDGAYALVRDLLGEVREKYDKKSNGRDR